MSWENARNYGLIDVKSNGDIRLYYDRNYFLTCPSPNPMMVVESAMWQGNNVIVRGRNQYGEPKCYLLRGQYSADQIS